MKSTLVLWTLFAALPLTATAQEARSTKWVNLRAGPARDYPLVARLGPGTPLAVQGCTAGFGWCDVIAPADVHGWIYAGNIAYPYQSAEVPILNYGAVIGFPIISFMIGDYWGQYYRNRPWYGHESRWRDRPPGFSPQGRPPGFQPPWGDRVRGAGHPGDNRPPRDARPPSGFQNGGGPGRPVNDRPLGGNRPPGGDRQPGGQGRPADHGGPGAHPPGAGNRPPGGEARAGGGRPAARPGPRQPGQPGRPGEHRR